MRFRSERGFTIFELIVGGAVVIGFVALASAAWSASQTSKVGVCVNQLNAAIAARATWAATVNTSVPFGDAALCQQVISIATKYNDQCEDRTGRVPVPTCS